LGSIEHVPSWGLFVAIVAMNEEAIMGQTLESVRWADEIVLLSIE
jgi:hypothetical protein